MKKIITVILLLSTFALYAETKEAPATTQTYTKGLHYTELNPAYETDNPEQVVVYEFFSYKCMHCSTFQPFIKPWHKKLPKHIKLVRIPVIFQPGWDILAKAYYTAETMGVIEQTHQAMFDAIHKQRKKFNSMEEVADWYAENFKVDKKAFLATAGSFMIDSKIRQSHNLMKKMHITSTPSLNINGKFKPDPKKLGSRQELLEFTSFLANEEARRMGLIE
ncbi:MAG: thiol:disulfide interchange protein DsbA/DsbL [Proteobacteria bacterium]|nr:thiol:disulfide interchange protein DsbA/DsbL [Pseudomonadota bacterium]